MAKHVGVSELRTLNSDKLRKLEEVLIIHERSQPISVLIPYKLFMRWQELCESGELNGRR